MADADAEFVLALTTLPPDFDAVALAEELVGAGVAACVSILPGMQSVYAWEGTIQVDREQQLVMKTTGAKIEPLWEALRARHPYELPEFVVVPIIEGNDDYLAWIEKSTG